MDKNNLKLEGSDITDEYEYLMIGDLELRRTIEGPHNNLCNTWHILLEQDSDYPGMDGEEARIHLCKWVELDGILTNSLEIKWRMQHDEIILLSRKNVIEEEFIKKHDKEELDIAKKEVKQAEARLELLTRGLDLIKEYNARFEQEYCEF